MRKRSILGEAAVLLGLVLLAFLLVRQGLGALRQTASADTTAACADNLLLLQVAFTQYAQQNDEVFPPMQNAQVFQAALLPYVKDPAVFRCPDTGLPYTPNAALSRRSYSSIAGTPDTVEVVRDSAAHVDGLDTVVFLDGHVEHGGVELGDPVVILTGREKDLALAVVMYTQDNDETYPPMHTPQELQAAVLPYTHSSRVFNAPSGQPFVPNAALSGLPFYTIPDPTTTVMLQDTPPYLNGVPTIAYADGHLERNGTRYGDTNVSVTSRAKQLALAVTQYLQDADETFPPMRDPQEFQDAVFPYIHSRPDFYNTNGQPFVPNAALSGVSLASIADPASTVLFQDTPPYTGGNPTTAYADGHVTHIVSPPPAHLLWTNADGRAAIWTVAADGSFTSTPGYGPIPGWTARSIADGPDGKTRLLWIRSDGQNAVWTVNPADGSFTSTPGYGPYDGGKWTVASLAVGSDNQARLQWKHSPDGQSSVWTIAADGSFTSTPSFGPYGPWTTSALAVDSDRLFRLLWGDGAGRFSVWALGGSGSLASTPAFGPIPGWSAGAVTGGPDSNPRLLLSRTDGAMAVWTVNAASAVASTPLYGPIPGWTCHGIAVGSDALSRVLWSRSDGMSAVWTINADGSIGSTPGYGPYSGWSAVALSVGP